MAGVLSTMWFLFPRELFLYSGMSAESLSVSRCSCLNLTTWMKDVSLHVHRHRRFRPLKETSTTNPIGLQRGSSHPCVITSQVQDQCRNRGCATGYGGSDPGPKAIRIRIISSSVFPGIRGSLKIHLGPIDIFFDFLLFH